MYHQVRYPDRITLIRGNHESRQITQVQSYYFTSVIPLVCSEDLSAILYSRFMDSMMNAYGSMVLSMFGDTALIYSIT